MKNQFFTVILILSVLLTACNLSTIEATSTPEVNLIYTMVAETVSAQGTMMAATYQVPPTPIPTAALTFTPLPTANLTPLVATSNPTQGIGTGGLASSSCDQAAFVADVTIPDGTVMSAGQSFTKTWRLKNAGSCTWNTSYKAVFAGGDAIGAAAAVALPQTVAPGATVDISVPMVAPTNSGNFSGYWKLENASSQLFGIGTNVATFSVVIVVQNGTVVTSSAGTAYPTATINYFAVQSVNSWSVSPSTNYTGACPVTIKLEAVMIASSAGDVTYHFIRGDGKTTIPVTKTYASGGSVFVTDSFDVSTSGTYSDAIYIDSPNHTNFGGPSNIVVTCP